VILTGSIVWGKGKTKIQAFNMKSNKELAKDVK
jgi:hypothetical protein